MPVEDGFPKECFCIGMLKRFPAFKGCKTAGQGDFSQEPGIGCAVPHLGRQACSFGYPPADSNAVINCRKAVEERAAFLSAGFNSPLRLFVPVVPGIAVDCRGKQIRLPFLLQVLQKLYMFFWQCHAGPGLEEGIACAFRSLQFLGKYLFNWQLFVVGYGIF